jgi:polysaccharide pyruvyl transferase WcaK-like protein
MFGQGIGPLTSPELARQAARVLKKVDLLMLREKRLGPNLLGRFGVDPAHVRVTGDDAVEMAYAHRPDRLGTNLGLNLRTGRRSGIDRAMIGHLRGALTAFARARTAGVVALPIALNPDHGDMEAIGEALGPEALAAARRSAVESPRAAICAASGCRIVVTAAYHAAVFALAQGVSALCLASSEYYLEKFQGLRDLFGEGCRVLSMNGPETAASLPDLLQESWERAEALRMSLLKAAELQIRSSHEAYEHLGLLIRKGRAA